MTELDIDDPYWLLDDMIRDHEKYLSEEWAEDKKNKKENLGGK